jgi:hypothetical protein
MILTKRYTDGMAFRLRVSTKQISKLLLPMNAILFSSCIFLLFRYPISLNSLLFQVCFFALLIGFYLFSGSLNQLAIALLLSVTAVSLIGQIRTTSFFLNGLTGAEFLTLSGAFFAVLLSIFLSQRNRSYLESWKNNKIDSFLLATSLIPAMYFGNGTPKTAFGYVATGNEDNLVWLLALTKTVSEKSGLAFTPDVSAGAGTATGSFLFLIQSVFDFALPVTIPFSFLFNPFVLKVTYGFVLLLLIWTAGFYIAKWLTDNRRELNLSAVVALTALSGIVLYACAATLMKYGHFSAFACLPFIWAAFGIRSTEPFRRSSGSNILNVVAPGLLVIGASLAWWPIFPAAIAVLALIAIDFGRRKSERDLRLTFAKAGTSLLILFGFLAFISPVRISSAWSDFVTNISVRGGADPISIYALVFASATLIALLRKPRIQREEIEAHFFEGSAREISILFIYASFIFLVTAYVSNPSGLFGSSLQYDFYAASKMFLVVLSILLPAGVLILGKKVLSFNSSGLTSFVFLISGAIIFLQLGALGTNSLFPVSVTGKSPGWISDVFDVAKKTPDKTIVCLNTIKGTDPTSYDMYLCTRMAGGFTGKLDEQESWATEVNLRQDFSEIKNGLYDEEFFQDVHVILSDGTRRHTGNLNQQRWSITLPWDLFSFSGVNRLDK